MNENLRKHVMILYFVVWLPPLQKLKMLTCLNDEKAFQCQPVNKKFLLSHNWKQDQYTLASDEYRKKSSKSFSALALFYSHSMCESVLNQ